MWEARERQAAPSPLPDEIQLGLGVFPGLSRQQRSHGAPHHQPRKEAHFGVQVGMMGLVLMLFLSTKVGVKLIQGSKWDSEGCGLSALALLRQWGKHGLGPSPLFQKNTF